MTRRTAPLICPRGRRPQRGAARRLADRATASAKGTDGGSPPGRPKAVALRGYSSASATAIAPCSSSAPARERSVGAYRITPRSRAMGYHPRALTRQIAAQHVGGVHAAAPGRGDYAEIEGGVEQGAPPIGDCSRSPARTSPSPPPTPAPVVASSPAVRFGAGVCLTPNRSSGLSSWLRGTGWVILCL